MIAIYTVITGDYDTIHQPQVNIPGADFILFTNCSQIILASEVNEIGKRFIGAWEIREIEPSNSANENILLSRKVKMLPHLYLDDKYSITIYIDADMVIKSDISELAEYLGEDFAESKFSMALYKNSRFVCVKDEIDSLIAERRVAEDVAKKQWQRYMDWGYKDDMGHTENGMLVRRHNSPQVTQLMELWWQEFRCGCLRDQVSFMPCVFRCRFNDLNIIDGNIWHNRYLSIEKHKKRVIFAN